MTRSNALGEYLRARRELVDPTDAGLRVMGVRRTPGLRREEVATLAGISADYYLRLEQGRDRNPSPQVLELRREKLAIGDSGGQLLVIYHAEPGSDSAKSLALLGSLAATELAATQADEAAQRQSPASP